MSSGLNGARSLRGLGIGNSGHGTGAHRLQRAVRRGVHPMAALRAGAKSRGTHGALTAACKSDMFLLQMRENKLDRLLGDGSGSDGGAVPATTSTATPSSTSKGKGSGQVRVGEADIQRVLDGCSNPQKVMERHKLRSFEETVLNLAVRFELGELVDDKRARVTDRCVQACRRAMGTGNGGMRGTGTGAGGGSSNTLTSFLGLVDHTLGMLRALAAANERIADMRKSPTKLPPPNPALAAVAKYKGGLKPNQAGLDTSGPIVVPRAALPGVLREHAAYLKDLLAGDSGKRLREQLGIGPVPTAKEAAAARKAAEAELSAARAAAAEQIQTLEKKMATAGEKRDKEVQRLKEAVKAARAKAQSFSEIAQRSNEDLDRTKQELAKAKAGAAKAKADAAAATQAAAAAAAAAAVTSATPAATEKDGEKEDLDLAFATEMNAKMAELVTAHAELESVLSKTKVELNALKGSTKKKIADQAKEIAALRARLAEHGIPASGVRSSSTPETRVCTPAASIVAAEAGTLASSSSSSSSSGDAGAGAGAGTAAARCKLLETKLAEAEKRAADAEAEREKLRPALARVAEAEAAVAAEKARAEEKKKQVDAEAAKQRARVTELRKEAATMTSRERTARAKYTALEKSMKVKAERVQREKLRRGEELREARQATSAAKRESNELRAELAVLRRRVEELTKKMMAKTDGSGGGGFDDTFEEVMQEELAMMRESFEAKLRLAKQEADKLRREGNAARKSGQKKIEQEAAMLSMENDRLKVVISALEARVKEEVANNAAAGRTLTPAASSPAIFTRRL